jgi:hypothetical protein
MEEDTPVTVEDLMHEYAKMDELRRQVITTLRDNDRLFTHLYLGRAFEVGDYPMDVCEEVARECKRKYTSYTGEPETMLDYYLQSFGYVLNKHKTVYRYLEDGKNEYPEVRLRSRMCLHEDLHVEVFNFIYQKMYYKKAAQTGRMRMNAFLSRPKASVEKAQARLRKRAREEEERSEGAVEEVTRKRVCQEGM